jgi:hypothetical protein
LKLALRAQAAFFTDPVPAGTIPAVSAPQVEAWKAHCHSG